MVLFPKHIIQTIALGQIYHSLARTLLEVDGKYRAFKYIILILSIIVLGASYIVGVKLPDIEKVSVYECGFDPFGSSIFFSRNPVFKCLI